MESDIFVPKPNLLQVIEINDDSSSQEDNSGSITAQETTNTHLCFSVNCVETDMAHDSDHEFISSKTDTQLDSSGLYT